MGLFNNVLTLKKKFFNDDGKDRPNQNQTVFSNDPVIHLQEGNSEHHNMLPQGRGHRGSRCLGAGEMGPVSTEFALQA